MAVHKDDSGWSVDFYYFDWRKKRHRYRQKGFKTKREAQAFIVSFKNRDSVADMTFGQLYDIYKADHMIHVKPTTYAARERLIRQRILPYFKDIPLSKITPATVRQWQNEMMTDTTRWHNTEERLLSQTYLGSLHKTLSAMFNFAVKYYGYSSNPAKQCGHIGSQNAENVNFWTIDEFQEFIEICRDNIMHYTIFMLLFWTGMRSGEMLALTENDFNFDDHTIMISKTLARLHGKNIIQTPKTRSSYRIVIMPQFLEDTIKRYLESIYELNPNDQIFPTTKRTLVYHFQKYIRQSGLRPIRLHDLRHSHASLLVDQGFPVIAIQERLGHRDIRTTLNTYSHLYPSQQRRLQQAMEKLEAVSNKKKDK